MKQFLFILLLLFSIPAASHPKFWFSNKAEIGFGKVFINETVTVKEGIFTKNRLATGLKFKVSDTIRYKTFYLLENKRKNNWAKDHFLGAMLEFRLK